MMETFYIVLCFSQSLNKYYHCPKVMCVLLGYNVLEFKASSNVYWNTLCTMLNSCLKDEVIMNQR